jgi:hypothetical protein
MQRVNAVFGPPFSMFFHRANKIVEQLQPLLREFAGDASDTGDVAAGLVEAGNQA